MIHLDTDTVVAYLRGHTTVATRLHGAIPNACMSSLTLGELLYGARISAKAKENVSRVTSLLRFITLVPFDENCAAAFAEIKEQLRLLGKPTGEMDALIAATAMAHSSTLVTHNRRHYESISGLRLEDWLA